MPQKKAHLKKARKDMCQQAARNGFEDKWNQRLQEIRGKAIQNLTEE
jgi:hypothetical protein